jgi:hypothetical protein
VRKWEGELLGDKLLHVRAAEVLSLLDLDDLEDLWKIVSITTHNMFTQKCHT